MSSLRLISFALLAAAGIAAAPPVGRANVATSLEGTRAEIIDPDGSKRAANRLVNGKIGDNDGESFTGTGAQAVVYLPVPCMINLVRIFPGQLTYATFASGECSVKACKVEVMNNGYWHLVGEVSGSPKFHDSKATSGDDFFIAVSFKPAKAEAVRVTIVESNDTGRRADGRLLPPEKHHTYIREIEIFSASKKAIGVPVLPSMLTGDFRLAVYRDQKEASIVLDAKKALNGIPVKITLTDEKTGKAAAPEAKVVLKEGENKITYQLAEIPDGRYFFTVVPDGVKTVRGELKRLLRIDRGGDWGKPAEPVAVSDEMIFPIDDYHFKERKGVVTEVVPAEAIQASRPLEHERTRQTVPYTGALNFDEAGNFVLSFTDASRSGKDPRQHYAISRDLKTWRIADETPTGKPNRPYRSPFRPIPEAARPRWQVKTPLDKATLRFHDAAKDGMPPLAEVRVHWFAPSRGDVTKFGLTPWGLYPVWEKNQGEWIVLTKEPLLVDKFTFESDELETELDGNDNFANQYLTDDGKTLVTGKAGKLRRFAPYTIEYDNLREALRIMRTFYSHDGVNWHRRYLVLPTEQDHWSSQHYGVNTMRIARNFYLGYLHAYHCTKQQIYPEIIYSRDGINYRRLPDPKPFIANGGPDDWTFGMMFLAGAPFEHDGEYLLPLGHVTKRQHFYLTYVDDISHITGEYMRRSYGPRNLAEQWPFFKEVGGWDGLAKNMHDDAASVGIARFRKDGWIRVRAKGDAELTSRLFSAPGSKLVVNGKGDLTIELLDADGKGLPGYSGADAARFKGDATAQPIAWAGGNNAELPATPFRVKISMPDASELYTLDFPKK